VALHVTYRGNVTSNSIAFGCYGAALSRFPIIAMTFCPLRALKGTARQIVPNDK
jgi:hypothetical protein